MELHHPHTSKNHEVVFGRVLRRKRHPREAPERTVPGAVRPGRLQPRLDIETGEEEPWELKDLRKTCATYYDEHVPESSVEILGHSVGGITYRHYAHLALRAIMTLPQPSAFSAILRGGTASARAAGGGSPTLADSVDGNGAHCAIISITQSIGALVVRFTNGVVV
jgi:hypothetical protein